MKRVQGVCVTVAAAIAVAFGCGRGWGGEILSADGGILAADSGERTAPGRCYPLGDRAAHVTGTRIGDYMCAKGGATNLIGVAGLEYACREVLKDGGRVRTTICIPVQTAVSAILKEEAVSNRAESAWALVVKIPNGEIVAMDAYPAVDPNARHHAWSEPSPLLNGAVQTLHEPGGLMKPLVYALAVEEGVSNVAALVDWDNATFTNLCHAVGTNALWRTFVKLRFGARLCGGMLYGEETGIVRPPCRWTPIDRNCLGMGQGLALTGVQLAGAYATLANGGVRVTPYLVASTSDADGKTLWTHPADPEERVFASEAAASALRRMRDVGGEDIRVDGVAVAAKSSTFALVEPHREYEGARYSSIDFDALYAGAFPAERPEYAVVVGFRRPKPEHAAENVARPALVRMVGAVLRSVRENADGKGQ